MNTVCEWSVSTDRGTILVAAPNLEEAKRRARNDGYIVLECYVLGCNRRTTTEAEGKPCCSYHRDIYDGYIKE